MLEGNSSSADISQMMSLWRIAETLWFGLAAFLLADMAFEFWLIHLLRRRHHGLWVEAGSPRASFWGYIIHSMPGDSLCLERIGTTRMGF